MSYYTSNDFDRGYQKATELHTKPPYKLEGIVYELLKRMPADLRRAVFKGESFINWEFANLDPAQLTEIFDRQGKSYNEFMKNKLIKQERKIIAAKLTPDQRKLIGMSEDGWLESEQEL